MAADLAHWFGQDLNASASGDILTVNGTARGQQRVLRRLLTNPGDYIWEPTYGGGLAAKIGEPFSAPAMVALIRSQMALESVVARDPAPIINVAQVSNGFYVQIQYVDSDTGETVPLNFTVTPPSS